LIAGDWSEKIGAKLYILKERSKTIYSSRKKLRDQKERALWHWNGEETDR